MPDEFAQVQETRKRDNSYSLREMLKSLMDADDFDNVVCLSLHGSDPVPVTSVEFEDGQIVLMAKL